MVKVLAFPPVQCTAYEWTVIDPVTVDFDQNGTAYFGQSLPRRRVARIVVPGISRDRAAAGYVDMLKRQMRGGVNFVRLQSMPAVWGGALRGMGGARGQVAMDWLGDNRNMPWVEGGTEMTWISGDPLYAVPETDGDFAAIRVTGLPPSQVVAYPSELIRMSDGVSTDGALVMTVARSDASGEALIRLTSEIAFAGDVVIGARETAVFRHIDAPPRTLQPVVGQFQYDFNFIEVLESEAAAYGGFEEVDPWH